MVDFNLVRDCYMKMLDKIDRKDLTRNISGRSVVYEYNPQLPGIFKSYYGDIEKCYVRSKMIDL